VSLTGSLYHHIQFHMGLTSFTIHWQMCKCISRSVHHPTCQNPKSHWTVESMQDVLGSISKHIHTAEVGNHCNSTFPLYQNHSWAHSVGGKEFSTLQNEWCSYQYEGCLFINLTAFVLVAPDLAFRVNTEGCFFLMRTWPAAWYIIGVR